jgi:hypothetical protein
MNLADYKHVDTNYVIRDVIKRHRELTGDQLPYNSERAIREVIDENYYVGEAVDPTPVKWYFRLSYPFYFFWLLINHTVFKAIKWILTGDSNFNRKSKYYQLMVKWEKGVEGKL